MYVQEYIDAVQSRIEECENMVRRYSSELMLDTEGIKEYTRKYVGSYFEESEKERGNLAKICLFLTESIMLEQGISSQVMKAEQVKQKLNQGLKLNEIFPGQ